MKTTVKKKRTTKTDKKKKSFSSPPRNISLLTSTQRINKNNNNFTKQYCRLERGASQWWPRSQTAHNAHLLRLPHFLLIGAKKAGTTALSEWLAQHPQIVPPGRKELLYFLPKRFRRFANKNGKNNNNENDNYNNAIIPTHKQYYKAEPRQSILVSSIRQDLYNEQHGNLCRSCILRNKNKITFEATPGYLFYSTLSRIPILCAMPWVKILVTVRNPIDRIYSEYNFYMDPNRRDRQRKLPPFEEWVLKDIANLKKTGVLPPSNATRLQREAHYGSPKESAAWMRYQKLNPSVATDNGVGRSLYILQLQEWTRALKEIGRGENLAHGDLMIVRNEDMKSIPNNVYQSILSWLGLPPFELESYGTSMVTKYTAPKMKASTRKMLYDLFLPYNERLYDFLQEKRFEKAKEWRGMYNEELG